MHQAIIDDDINRKHFCTAEEARELLKALRSLHQELSPLARLQFRMAFEELAKEQAPMDAA